MAFNPNPMNVSVYQNLPANQKTGASGNKTKQPQSSGLIGSVNKPFAPVSFAGQPVVQKPAPDTSKSFAEQSFKGTIFETPIGQKADNPNLKVTQQDKTLPAQFTANSSAPGGRAAIASAQNQIVNNQNPVVPPPVTPPATSVPPPTYGGIMGQLIQRAGQDSPEVQKARADLLASQTNQANALAANAANPIPLEFQQGRGQILQTQYGQQQAALANALQSATTTQGQQLSALGQAAGLAQPQLAGYTQQVFNPLTGKFESGGGQFGTGPAAGANVASIQQQTQQLNDYASARQSTQQLSSQLGNLISQNGINPSDFNAVNRFIQGVMGQTSSPQYQTFSNIVNDLAARYAQILTPAGGSQTDMVRSIAQSLLNATASGQSIMQVISALDQQAQGVMSGLQQNIQNLQTGQNVNQSGTPSGGSLWSW